MATINSGVKVSTPSACSIAAGSVSGSLSAGNYSYKVTYVTNFGETGASAASNVVAAAASSSMIVSSIPVWTDNNVISRKLYRTTAGGSTYFLCATIADNSTTTYTDTLADGSLPSTQPPAASTADSLQTVNGYISFQRPIQVSVTNGITAFAGGGQANATLLFSQANILSTVGTAGDSVILPLLNSNLIGLTIEVKNNGANSANVFPASGQTINALSANTALAVAATANNTFRAVSATNWQTFA